MAKLALLVFVVCTLTILFFDIAESVDAPEEDEERAGARASANAVASIRPGFGPVPGPSPFPGPGPFPGPNPGPRPGPGLFVQCYTCVDCQYILPNTTSKLCPLSMDTTKARSCVTYAEHYSHMRKPWYIRGCATERGSCAEIKQAHAKNSEVVKLKFCHECEGDKCNGAPRSLSDFTVAIIALIVTPLIGKFTFS